MENFDIKSFALGVSSNSGGGYPEPTGTKNITENGIHNVKDYAEANVNVPVPPSPTGTINITQNGTYDVTEKAEANVNVPDIPADIEALTVNANGTYTATECDGFSPVTVNVPNTYSSTDEGKVVNNGALASQTSTTKTANGTYDTTLNNEVVVNVPTPAPDLEDITITENGTYESQDHDGYGEVTVNVSGGSTPDYYVEFVMSGGDYTTGVNCHHICPNNIARETNTVTSVTFTNDITHIGSYAFQGTRLTSITLPSSLHTISNNAFRSCQYLTSLIIPASVENIVNNAFDGCTGLLTVEFKGTPSSINSTTFRNCTAITDIYVPWSEGEVANAPWGATSATIHYDWSN